MAASLSEGLEELVTCPICFEQFQDPRVLPCLHTYCKQCLESLLLEEGRLKTNISCPECRSTVQIQNIDDLKVNFKINNMISLLEKEKANKPAPEVPSRCQKHHETLKLFCETCEVLVCCECVVIDHKEHKFGYFEDVAKTRKEFLLAKQTNSDVEFCEEVKNIINSQDLLLLMLDKATLEKEFKSVGILLTEEDQDVYSTLALDLTKLESLAICTKKMLVTHVINSESLSMFRDIIMQQNEHRERIVQKMDVLNDIRKRGEPTEMSQEKSSFDPLQPTAMSKEAEEMEKTRERKGLRPSSFPAANLTTTDQRPNTGQRVENPMMKELQTAIKASETRRMHPPKTLPKRKPLQRQNEDSLSSSCSNLLAEGNTQQGQRALPIPSDIMMKELHTAITSKSSKSDGVVSGTHMPRGNGEREREVEDVKSPTVPTATGVAALRRTFEKFATT